MGDTSEGKRRFAEKHQISLERNCAWVHRSAIVDGGRKKEYLLAPLWGQHPEQGKIPMFGIYDTSCTAGDFLLKHVLKPRRLPVVFDLDETLVKARTLSKQQSENHFTTISKRKTSIEMNDKLSPEEKKRRLEILDFETKPDSMLGRDLKALYDYTTYGYINHPVSGVVHPKRVSVTYYHVGPDGAPRQVEIDRNVIQLDQDTLFTRIRAQWERNPAESCMIFRIRPQWFSAMRPRLVGEVDEAGLPLQNGSPIVEAFVCTTAEASYAHEVWRVLDNDGKLIPSVKCKFLLTFIDLCRLIFMY